MKLTYSIHAQFLVAHAGDCAAMVGCDIPGQVFQFCAPCEATCTNPTPICPLICRPGCACSPGTLLDEERNRCTRKCPRDESQSKLALPLKF